jgi:pimeloyl-ACP methyl ester carboxylesterase
MSSNRIESHKIKINGRKAHYLKAGRGPAVVLIHGGASDARDWIGIMETLGDRFSFYALDLLGYGQSEKNETGYYLADYADFLTGFINVLNLKKPALAGHSLGGRFCLDATIKHPHRVSKLVLIDTTGLGKMSAFGSALQYIFWRFKTLLRIKLPYPTFLMKPGEQFDRNYDEELRRLQTPTLIVWKRLDPYYPANQARRAAKMIPKVKLALMSGWGHAPHKKNVEKFSRILAEFLDGAGD